MATLKDAEKARVVMADQLQGYGAHAISVQELEPEGDLADTEDGSSVPSEPSTGRRRASYEVVAWFAEEPPDTLPAEVEIQRGTKTVMVPVRVRREERFQLE